MNLYVSNFRLGFSEVGTVIGVSNVVAFVLGLVLGGAIMRIKDWHREFNVVFIGPECLSKPNSEDFKNQKDTHSS